MKARRRRSGFTLPEVFVTGSVVAVLAAAVVPAVTRYVNDGSTPASRQDIAQLRTAVTAFAGDVHRYPGDLQQLVTPIVPAAGSGDSLNLDASASPARFTPVEAARWKGPYTSAPITTTATEGGRLASNGLVFTIGRKITLVNGWLTVPILVPESGSGAAVCGAMLALNAQIDTTTTSGQEPTDGSVVWDAGGCDAENTARRVTHASLRLVPAN